MQVARGFFSPDDLDKFLERHFHSFCSSEEELEIALQALRPDGQPPN